MKLKLSIIFILLLNVLLSQEKKIVQIIEAGSFDKNEITLPGANILKKNNKIRVHLLHDGMDIWSDYALFYKKNNSFKAVNFENNDEMKNFISELKIVYDDLWKDHNQINTSINNKLECKFKINNIHELQYVRSLLKSNILVQNLTLKSIELNNNLYSILFVGDIENFKNSLKLSRLNLFYQNNLCNIKLV